MSQTGPEKTVGATGGLPGDNAAFTTRALPPDELAVVAPGAGTGTAGPAADDENVEERRNDQQGPTR